MSEALLAHFLHRWEAEFAQGYLQDAGIPVRIMDDGLIGAGAYTGDLVGTSLFVAPADEARARATLEAAGMLESPETRPPPLMERELPPLLERMLGDATYAGDLAAATDHLTKEVREGDVVLTLGAGSVWTAGEELLRKRGGGS